MARAPRLRPTFAVAMDGTPRLVAGRLREALASHGDGLATRWAGGHLILTLPRAQRRMWSPWLHADVRTAQQMGRDPADGPVVVWCRFSPHPGLWTGFMLTLIAVKTIALFALAFALSQWTLERPQWGWWIVLGCVAVAGAMIVGSLTAQRLAADQMRELRSVVEDALGCAGEPPVSPGTDP